MDIYYKKTELGKEKEEARLLLKRAFNDKNYNLDDCEIFIQAHGKPCVKGIGFDFNISHTQGFVMCAVGTNVGVDCQKFRHVKQNVIKRVCNDEEILTLEKSTDKEKEFIKLWAFKEAFTKMIGSGFKYGFKKASVYNALYLYENIKIFQKSIDDIELCAIEATGSIVNIIELN